MTYLSILMATRLRIEAVLRVTSNAIQKSQTVSLSSQSTFTFVLFVISKVLSGEEQRNQEDQQEQERQEEKRRRK